MPLRVTTGGTPERFSAILVYLDVSLDEGPQRLRAVQRGHVRVDQILLPERAPRDDGLGRPGSLVRAPAEPLTGDRVPPLHRPGRPVEHRDVVEPDRADADR